MSKYSFQNDYSDGAHPQILAALAAANTSQQTAYGEDAHTAAAAALIRQHAAAPTAAVHLVASGTLANIIALSSCLRPHECIVATSTAHIATHETGAIEAAGHKVVTVPPVHGKLTPAALEAALAANALFPHMAKPRLVYVSNATELGTVYTKAELQALSALCRARGLLLFLDGARLAVALAAPQSDVALADVAALTDMFWFGGTKAGALCGEALVIRTPALQEDLRFHIKQRGGLLAKGRVLGVQFEALFREGLVFELARHANAMAAALGRGVRAAGFELVDQIEANMVFAVLPDALVARLLEEYAFHVWERREGGVSVVRLVTSWATEVERVDAFVGVLKSWGRDVR